MVEADPALRAGLLSDVPVRQARGRLYGTLIGRPRTLNKNVLGQDLAFPTDKYAGPLDHVS
jgi:hypothetical protein